MKMENSPPHLIDKEQQNDDLHSESDYVLPLHINCVLTLETKSLHCLPEKVFQTSSLNNVKEIILQGSNIQNLPRSFTSNLQRVEIMKMDRNQLNELPYDLKILQFLKYLSVSQNNLKELCNDISALINLEHLNVSYNALTYVPECIVSLVNLMHLNLCNNYISELPHDIGALVSLEHLNVANNLLSCLPSTINNLRNLVYLNVSSNSISDLPDSFHSVKLLTLILSKNNFNSIPDCLINNLHFISVLDISFNKIMFFDCPPKCVGKLIKLDISNNAFHDIPPWLFSEKCRLLRELNISDNKNMIGRSEISVYSKSGDTLGVSTSLKVLNASNCCFSASSVEFLNGLKALESLTLGNEVVSKSELRHIGNILFNFPSKSLYTCTNVKYLNMNNVGLADLPEDIGNLLPKLEILDVGFNQLLNVPDTFCKLVALTTLQMSCNELQTLPSEFGLLSTLKEVKLDGNKLQFLPDSFKKLKKLHLVDLYDNNFGQFPVVLLDLPLLEACDVDFNFFCVDSICDQEYKTFIEKYSVLKKKLRSYFCHKNINYTREDGKKIDFIEENVSEDGEISSNGLEDVSSDEFVEQRPMAVSEEYDKNQNEVENWDASDDSDSHFDPNKIQKTKKIPSYGPSLLVYDAVSTSPENFCPADLHSDPIKRCSRYAVKKIAEGQFEDADL